MALINCHECNNQVSTKAVACPKCGAPGPESESRKHLKYQIAVSSLVFWSGFIMVFSAGASAFKGNLAAFPMLMLAGGLTWYIVTKVRIWSDYK